LAGGLHCIEAVIQSIRTLAVEGDIESLNHNQQLLDSMTKRIRRSAIIGNPSKESVESIIHAIDRAKGVVNDSGLLGRCSSNQRLVPRQGGLAGA
jgi:hypothetical protein